MRTTTNPPVGRTPHRRFFVGVGGAGCCGGACRSHSKSTQPSCSQRREPPLTLSLRGAPATRQSHAVLFVAGCLGETDRSPRQSLRSFLAMTDPGNTHTTSHPGRSAAKTRDLSPGKHHPALRAPLLSGLSPGRRGRGNGATLQDRAEKEPVKSPSAEGDLGGWVAVLSPYDNNPGRIPTLSLRATEESAAISCGTVRGRLPSWDAKIAPQEYSFAPLTAPRPSLRSLLAMTDPGNTYATRHPGRSSAGTRDLHSGKDHPALRAPLLSDAGASGGGEFAAWQSVQGGPPL